MELLVIRHGLPLRVERNDGEPADPVVTIYVVKNGRFQVEEILR